MDHGDESPALRIELAAAAMLQGHEADALEWVSRAYDAGYRDHALLDRDPILAPLRAEPHYRDILGHMSQDVAAQRARARQRGLLEVETLLRS